MTSKYQDKGVLEKTSTRLWKEDLDYLRATYPDNYNAHLRRIVAAWVEQDKLRRQTDEEDSI